MAISSPQADMFLYNDSHLLPFSDDQFDLPDIMHQLTTGIKHWNHTDEVIDYYFLDSSGAGAVAGDLYINGYNESDSMDMLLNGDHDELGIYGSKPVFNEMSMIKTVVLSVIFVISFIGNTTTLVQMFRMRRRKSTINTLIMHLAIADLLVTFFCNVTDAVWASTVQWYGGNFMCKFLKFMQVFGLYLSTYIIVIISLDRCMAILDPMSRNLAPKRVRVMIITAWICSALFSLPQVSFHYNYCLYILCNIVTYLA